MAFFRNLGVWTLWLRSTKKGSVHLTQNYRGIAVSNCIAKLFLTIIHNRLKSYAEANCLIPPNQIGYKKGSQTTDHTLSLANIINKYIHALPRKYLFAYFVDFKSAFDTLWRDGLFYEMKLMGIDGNILQLLQNMYQQVQYSVKKTHSTHQWGTLNRLSPLAVVVGHGPLAWLAVQVGSQQRSVSLVASAIVTPRFTNIIHNVKEWRNLSMRTWRLRRFKGCWELKGPNWMAGNMTWSQGETKHRGKYGWAIMGFGYEQDPLRAGIPAGLLRWWSG